MAKEDLLQYQFTSEQSRKEAAENGQKGGIASGEARRKKKRLGELVRMFGDLEVQDTKQNRIMMELGIPQEDRNRFMQSVVSLFQKAMKGDVSAFNAIRDIIGEKPVDRTQVSGGLDANIVVGYVESGHKPVASEAEVET